MKVVLGIIVLILVIASLGLFVFLVLNSNDLIYCGDLKGNNGNTQIVTRIYTADLNADETLSQIVAAVNDGESGSLSSEEMTEILATYQNIIYAPVFTFNLEKVDENTFVLTGSVYNGLDEDGNPTVPDFYYKNLTLTAGVANGAILAAQNIYSQDIDDSGEYEFVERKNVVDPIIIDNGAGAAFAFRECDTYRVVFTRSAGRTASITLGFTYEVVASNPLNFTSINDGALGITVMESYDSYGRLAPEIKLEKVYRVDE
ncbi:MAG: hypothetical protein J1F03_05640 [Oscillospiraceae bacterium]|nr:hypothetical protein [Oscillospiraceae bacterium]